MSVTAGPGQSTQARLAALEQAVQALAEGTIGPESLNPNYLTVNPQGQTGASFTGLVNALGLILPAAVAQQLPAQTTNQVVWEDTGSGALVASLEGFSVGPVGSGGRGMIVQSVPEANGDSSYIVLRALSDSGDPNQLSDSAAIQISQLNRGQAPPPNTIGSYTEVDLFVGATRAKLYDSAGASTFVQAPNSNNVFSISGPYSLGPQSVAPGAVQNLSFNTGRNWNFANVVVSQNGGFCTYAYSSLGSGQFQVGCANPFSGTQVVSLSCWVIGW
jgi:hypothetical protein